MVGNYARSGNQGNSNTGGTMKQINLVGIDVGSKELTVTFKKSRKEHYKTTVFDNNRAGHKKLAKYISTGTKITRVCMEATGIYHFELALFLSKARNIEVMVSNPKAIKHFAIASQQRAKTDKVDSELILKYLKCMAFVPWQVPAENNLKIQSISRRMFQLKAEINREANRRHAGDYGDVSDGFINNDIDINVRHIKKRIEILKEKALKIIQSDEELNKLFKLLVSITGIAETSATQILSEIICLPQDMVAEQWVAYAGLDPKAVESGSSINKPRRISKAGNKYLRAALYMPALVAIQKDPHVKAFYDKLKDVGKKSLQAIVAVMRKLLHCIWGIFKSSTAWDGEKFYVKKA